MFGLGIIKGTIIGMGIGIITSFAIREACKFKKKKDNISQIEEDSIQRKDS